MANKVGKLIKEARTNAGMTQEQLAKKVKNTTASDISKAERGELKLSQDALKQIAKATGVTQKSLLDAASSSSYKSSSTTKKTSTKSVSTASKSSVQVTASERRLVELYRNADSAAKKKAVSILKGETQGILETLIEGASESGLLGNGKKKQGGLEDILGGLLG